MTATNEFLKRDVEDMIKKTDKSLGYIRGYIDACYFLQAINQLTFEYLQEYLRNNLDNIIKRNKEANHD